MPPEGIASKAKGKHISPHIAQKCSQRVSLIALRIEDPSLRAAKKKVVGILGEVEENWRSHQSGHDYKDACLLPFSLGGGRNETKMGRERALFSHLFSITSSAPEKQKTQAEKEKQEGREPGGYVSVW